MECQVRLCDLCLGEGETKFATAEYQDQQERWWDICGRHITIVKDADLHYEEFQEPGNIDLSNYQ